jgi:transcriptional regulator with XRE-family HTH domain
MASVRILLAKNMKRFREISSISQMELAEKIGCSPTLIGKIETMKRFPSAENIDRIAEALKISPSDLFADVPNSEAVETKAVQHSRKTLLITKILKAIDEAF